MDRPFYSSDVQATTTSVRDQLDHVIIRVYKVGACYNCELFICKFVMQIFDSLLRACPESKKALLTWLVSCLECNNDRGKMASRLNRALAFHQTQASDGFFLNLCWVMLRLCSPFLISDKSDSTRTARIRTIDVSYANCDKSRVKFVDNSGPLVNFSEDAKLVPLAGLSDIVYLFNMHIFFTTYIHQK